MHCNNQVHVKYWGNVWWCPHDDFNITEVISVSFWIEIQALTPPYQIHKRGGYMFPLVIHTGHINYCLLPLSSAQLGIDAYYSVYQSLLKAPDLSWDGRSIQYLETSEVCQHQCPGLTVLATLGYESIVCKCQILQHYIVCPAWEV